MAITRAQVANISELAAWMQTNAVPGIFKAVTYADDTLTATDADDNTVLEIKINTGGYFRAFRGSGNYFSISMQYVIARNTTSDIIGCDNGFMLTGKVEDSNLNQKDFAFLCAKTNNDKVAIIFPSTLSSTANARYTTALQHVAFGDSSTMSTTTTFTPESAQQTCMTPFITNADVGDVSYTPNARYLTAHSSYASGIGKMLLGTDTWITNGYWAIKDGGAT